MEERKEILDRSRDLFLRYGFKSVTMDDIARENGVSKKTLYKFVENKDDLVRQVFESHMECEMQAIETIQNEASNAVEEMLMIANYILDMLRKISPSAIYDMKKYYPHMWKLREGFHNKKVYAVIKRNLDKGIKEGWYRFDMDTDIVAKMYVKKTDIVADEVLFPPHEYRRDRLYKEFIKYHMRGILNEKGAMEFNRMIDDI